MNVRFSEQSLRQLSDILDSFQGNQQAKNGFLRRLDVALAILREFPQSTQSVQQRPEFRRVVLKRYPYIFYYQMIDGEIVILQIVHGARQQPWVQQ